MLTGNGIPNTIAEPPFDPKPAYEEVDVIEVVDPFAEVVDPLLRFPSPEVECELDTEFFRRMTFLFFFSGFTGGFAGGIEDEERAPTEKAA